MKKIMLLLTISVLIVPSCYPSSQIVTTEGFRAVEYKGDEKIGVMIPADGFYFELPPEEKEFEEKKPPKKITNYGSGIKVTKKIIQTLYSKFDEKDIIIITGTNKRSEAIEKSHKLKLSYLIILDILKWEERETEWSGLADKLDVNMEYYDLEKNLVLNSIGYSGGCSYFDYGYHVEDLMDEEKFHRSIYDLIGMLRPEE